MGIQLSQIDDLVLETQELMVKRGAFVNMQTDLQDHVAVREMWKGRKKTFSGGENWRFDVQMDHNHSARTVGLFETDGSALTDAMVKGEVPVRHVNAHYLYDLHEPDFQKNGTKVVDLIETRYSGMLVSLFELLETLMWGKPVDSTDDKSPFGIAYWVTRSNTEGFNGGNPSGFSGGKAGISQSAYSRWANWTAQYAAVTKTDLLRKMRTAHRRCMFRSPLSHAEPSLGSMANGIYTNDTVIGLLEEVVEDQNMNLGNDLDSKGGRVTFKGTPLTYVPFLNSDTADPVYMLDWKWLSVGVMDGWENNLSKPYMVPNKHLVRRVDLDASMNMICTDLRRQSVINK